MKKILHHAFWGFVAYMAIGVTEVAAGFTEETSPIPGFFALPRIVLFLIGAAVFLVASAKIITYEHRAQLKAPSGILWKPEYLKPALIGFAVLLAASALFITLQDVDFLSLAVSNSTALSPEDQTETFTNYMVLLLGMFFLWMLFLKNLVIGIPDNWQTQILTFIKNDVSVFLLFRAILFLLSLVAAIIMGPQSEELQQDFFLFALDDAQVQALATGSLSGGGSFFSGVTEAASFFVLTTMAQEFLEGKSRDSWPLRLRRMFLEEDTVKLALMALLCILSGFISAGTGIGFISDFVGSLLLILWFISMLLFIADTKILPYAIIFSAMGFIERLLPVPEVSGLLVVVYPLMVGARIFLFACVALLIANYDLHRQEILPNISNVRRDGLPTFSYILRNATFMDLLIFIDRLGTHAFRAFSKNPPAGESEEDIIFVVALAKNANEYISKFVKKITDALDSI